MTYLITLDSHEYFGPFLKLRCALLAKATQRLATSWCRCFRTMPRIKCASHVQLRELCNDYLKSHALRLHHSTPQPFATMRAA